MAAREKSVVQGALIVCILFLVASLAGNYFLWSWGDTAESRAAQATEQARNSDNQVRNLTAQTDTYRRMIGIDQFDDASWDAMKNTSSGDAKMKEAEDMFRQDMALMGPALEASRANYHALPQYLMQTLRQRNEAESRIAEQLASVSQEKDAIVAAETKTRADLQASKDQLQATLTKVEKQFEDDRAQMNLDKQKLVDQVTKTVADAETERRRLNQEITTHKKKIDELGSTIEFQKRRIQELLDDEFESAQGNVVSVAAGGDKVYINLGSADQLRTGIIFGVLDPDQVRVSGATPKAKIEVIAVRSGHLAEARVIERQDPRTRILPDDLIYSAFWEPGRKVKIALAGFMDINGDGRDDQQEIKALIESAGAEVVAMLPASGANPTGDIDFDTRFVVIGSNEVSGSLDDPTDVDNQKRVAQALGAFRAKADDRGITVISVNKLLGWIRALGDGRTVPLLGQARAEDFPPEAVSSPNSRVQQPVSELYRRQQETK